MDTLERWTPIRELDRMERRVRRLFEDAGFFANIGPAADVYETGEEFVVELEVPGFEEKELDVEVADHMLVVKGERTAETETNEKTILLRERLELDFERRFALPPTADNDHVSADFAKGVLTLHVPKVAEAKPHKVTIARK
jgi:HSP20 family protein